MYFNHTKKSLLLLFKTALTVFLILSIASCKQDNNEINTYPDNPEVQEETISLKVEAVNEGNVIFHTSQGFYRYGPSIMEYEDGSMDMWMSSPGNSGSQWDWITYRHSDDGVNWSSEQIVLRPTPGSKDQCSVCDPGVIYFNGYYYLAYTGTDYYEGKGSYNMAFVSRSENPYGPFEKWNGSGWGGNPEPFIYYDGGKDNWGIGEVSFVIYENDLCIYYTYIDIRDSYIGLYKADLVDNWPGLLRDKGPVLYSADHDSVEIVYDENLDIFLAFTMEGRMMEGSRLVLYESNNGKDFHKTNSTKEYIEDHAHNLGIAKSSEGFVDTSKELLIGYAYGPDWGRWDLKVQNLKVTQ